MKELVGNIAVDSGQIMIVDPCYLNDWVANEYTDFEQPPTGKFDYNGACTATVTRKGFGILSNKYCGLAAVSSSGYGDGEYPVYATRNSDGRIIRLTIEFDEGGEA